MLFLVYAGKNKNLCYYFSYKSIIKAHCLGFSFLLTKYWTLGVQFFLLKEGDSSGTSSNLQRRSWGTPSLWPAFPYMYTTLNGASQFPDNSSLRKSKHFSLRLLLVSHYEIMIRDLAGVCQQNSCWSRCVDTAQCCNDLVISVFKIKPGIICSMSRYQSAADQGVMAWCLNLVFLMPVWPWGANLHFWNLPTLIISVLGNKVSFLE